MWPSQLQRDSEGSRGGGWMLLPFSHDQQPVLSNTDMFFKASGTNSASVVSLLFLPHAGVFCLGEIN